MWIFLLEQLKALDKLILWVINAKLKAGPLDVFFCYITNSAHYQLPMIFGSVLLLFFSKRKGLAVILLATLAVALDGLIGSQVMKHLIARPRPCRVLVGINEIAGCSRTFSFPSGHASMSFSIAFVMIKFYRWQAIPILILAGLVAYSRIYAGVHYPSDVAAGLLLGTVIAMLLYFGARKSLHFFRTDDGGECADL